MSVMNIVFHVGDRILGNHWKYPEHQACEFYLWSSCRVIHELAAKYVVVVLKFDIANPDYIYII